MKCVDCGAGLSDRCTRSNLRYCHNCRKARDRQHRREYKARVAAKGVVKPPPLRTQETLVCVSCMELFQSIDLLPICPKCVEPSVEKRRKGRPCIIQQRIDDPHILSVKCKDCGQDIWMPASFPASVPMRCLSCADKKSQHDNVDIAAEVKRRPHWALARKVARESFYRD